MSTSFSKVNSDCMEGKKSIMRAAWTGCRAFIFGNIQNLTRYGPEQTDKTLNPAFL